MKKEILILCLCAIPLFMRAQLNVQSGGTLYLQENAELFIQGDIDVQDNVEGEGRIMLNGASQQIISTHNYSLPSLWLQNQYGVVLNSPLRISRSMVLQSGRLSLDKYNLELGTEATASGNSTAYIAADGDGKIIKKVAADLSGFMIPTGTVNNYAPLLLRSAGNYNGARIEIGAKDKASPNKPLSSKDYLESYWTINRSGINGELFATAFYKDVYGNEENIHPYYWNGNSWIRRDNPVDTKNKLLSITVPEGRGEIYAMHKGDELVPAAVSMTLLPNPVRNAATLIIRSNTDETAAVRITDSNGSAVLLHRVNLRKGLNQVNINVMSLAGGQYIISSTQKNARAITMIKQ